MATSVLEKIKSKFKPEPDNGFCKSPHIAETMQRKRSSVEEKKIRKIKVTQGQLRHIINSTRHTSTNIFLLPLKCSVQSQSSRISHKPDWPFWMVMGVCFSRESQEAKIYSASNQTHSHSGCSAS